VNKDLAVKLREFSLVIAGRFSHPDREKNPTHEIFTVDHIFPLSDSTAAITFKKNTDKKAVAFCYAIKGGWYYFFPTDSHLVGMEAIGKYKLDLENFNFSFNFVQKEVGEEG
jgi:hypothetical protein